MATDLERLVVSLEANIKGYERALAKAMNQTNSQAGRIEKRFREMNKNIANSFDFGGALARAGGVVGGVLSANAAREFLDSAQKINNALKVAGLSGDELERVYSGLYRSAQRNAAPLEDLATLYGRVALSQKELGVTSGELGKFTDNVAIALKVSGKSAQESGGALLQLSQALGAGTVRAEEFNSILEGAPTIAQAAARGITEAGGSVAKLKQLINDGEVSSKAFFFGFQAGADGLRSQAAATEETISQAFTKLKNTAINAARDIDKSAGVTKSVVNSVNDLAAAIETLANAVRKFLNLDMTKGVAGLGKAVRDVLSDPTLEKYINFLDPGLASRIFARDPNAVQSNKDIEDRAKGIKSLAEAFREQEDARRGSVPKPADPNNRFDQAFQAFSGKPISLKDFPADKKKEKESLDPFERAVAQVERRTAVMNAETKAIDLGAAAQQRARIEVELETAAKRANEAAGLKNTEVTEKQRAKITELADAYMRASQAAEQANSPLRQFARDARDTDRMLQETAVGGLRTLEDGLVDIITGTESVSEAFKKMANAILADLARIAIRQAITGPLAGALGGLLGGGSSIGSSIPRYADGTDFHPGGLAIVGERGRELVKLPRGSQVIPNNVLRRSGGSSSVTVAPVYQIDARGADQAAVTRLERTLAAHSRVIEAQGKAMASAQRYQSTGVM